MGTTISSVLSIKFWKQGEPSFNESVVQEAGVNAELFFAPHNSEDPERIQIHDTSDIPQRLYQLKIYDDEGVVVDTLMFTHVLVGGDHLYDLQFKFEDLGLINGLYKLKIVSTETIIAGSVIDDGDTATGTLTFFLAEFEISGAVDDDGDEAIGDVEIVAGISLSNNSLDIQITNVAVEGVNATLQSGSLPLGTGSGATMSTKETGFAQDVEVFYTVTVAGQHISITDSDGNIQCQGSGVGSPMLFSGVIIKPELPISIDAADGACPP